MALIRSYNSNWLWVFAVSLIGNGCISSGPTKEITLEDINKIEEDSVLMLLQTANNLQQKDSLLEARYVLNQVQQKFPTHKEIIKVNQKIKLLDSQIAVIANNNNTNPSFLDSLYHSTFDPELKRSIRTNLERELISTSSRALLESYLASNNSLLMRGLAEKRLAELTNEELERSYYRLKGSDDISELKEFINENPNHSGIDEFQQRILTLESQDILSHVIEGNLIVQTKESKKNITTIEVDNNGRYTVSIYVQGIKVQKLNVPPYEHIITELEDGKYVILCKVHSPSPSYNSTQLYLKGEHLLTIPN